MPQVDVLAFPAAVALFPFAFVGGYSFFLTRGVPRLLLLFRARVWLTRFEVRSLGVAAAGVPEFTLGVIQFIGLVGLVGGLTFVTAPTGEIPLRLAPPILPGRPPVGVGSPLVGWADRRGSLFFAPLAVALTGTTARAVEIFFRGGFPARFPVRLRARLARGTKMSGSSPRVGG